jgi:hypothetical protein
VSRDRLAARRPLPQFKGLDIQMVPEFPAPLLPYLNMAGTAVFAISGALAAARARQTPLTFAFFAVVTGIGGSTLSELLMGVPVALGSSSHKYRRLPCCGARDMDHASCLVAE